MSAHPARHRVTRNDASGCVPGFWAAEELLDPTESSSAPRHARKGTPRYAVHVGRVGALAVSLGIGMAIANSATGVAFAESDATAGSTGSPPPAKAASGGDEQSAGTTTTPADDVDADDEDVEAPDVEDVDDAEDVDAEDVDVEDVEDVEDGNDTDVDGGDQDPEATTVDLTVGDAEYLDVGDGTDDLEVADSDGGSSTTVAQNEIPPAVVDSGSSARTTTVSPQSGTEVSPTPASQAVSLNLVGATVSTVIAPLVDPALPAPSPLTDGLLAWLRRLITHTFFNKTPVVRSVRTEQLLTGQVLIDIDAYDPNGDPLTYEIIQPEGALVFQVPLTTQFVYTRTLPVIGDPVPVTFDIIIHDDSEHLTGVLGGVQNILHSIARLFGLAQADNRTVPVFFNAAPIVSAPPALVVVGGLPYVLGGNPVDLLSVVTIVDVDSPEMKEATVAIGAGRQGGDKLRYTAPAGVSINVEQVNEYTLKFTGVASQADYIAALKAVTFSTTDLGLLGRTVDVTITDKQGLDNLIPAFALATVLPGLTLPLDVPPSVVAIGGLPFFLGGQPVDLLSAAEIVDPDSGSLKEAIVTIGDLTRAAGDKLTYVAPAGVSISVEQVNDWTLKLTGEHSTADYESALKAITFSATQLGLVARTVEITLTDAEGNNSLLPALAAVTVLPGITLELPLIVTPVGLPVHTIGKAPVKLLSEVGIANADDGKLKGAVVAIGVTRAAGDKLGYTAVAGNPVTVVQTNDWTLTLSGTATVEQYQEALKSITFSATQLGVPRTVTISVTEVDGDTSPAPGIVFANSIAPLRPAVVVPSLPPTYTIGRTGVVLMPAVEIEDLDSDVLTGASLTFGVTRQAGDKLAYVTPAGGKITAVWNGTDTLTLSGTASVQEYEAALEAVTFTATGGALVPRTVTVNVIDDSGLNALVPGLATALVKNPDRPTVVALGLSTLAFPRVGTTVKPLTSVTIVDTDSWVLTRASVKITGNLETGDTLAYSPITGNPITATYDTSTGELKLVGTATVAQYKQALEAVTFKATRYGGGLLDLTWIRTLSIYVTDDSNVSNTLPGVVAVTVLR